MKKREIATIICVYLLLIFKYRLSCMNQLHTSTEKTHLPAPKKEVHSYNGYFYQIGRLNDKLRLFGKGGNLLLSEEVSFLSPVQLEFLIKEIRHSSFSEADDPYNVRDW